MTALPALLKQVRACTLCAQHLPHGVRPILQAHERARILIAGQAPGRKVHESGVPFDDASGDRLREWMGISREVFYDATQVAIVPMGFCFPGRGKSGDLPPRAECAPAWRARLLEHLRQLRLTLVIGQYAQAWHLECTGTTLTETVRAACQSGSGQGCGVFALPHPSPRNNIWLRRNPWFEAAVLPQLRSAVAAALAARIDTPGGAS